MLVESREERFHNLWIVEILRTCISVLQQSREAIERGPSRLAALELGPESIRVSKQLITRLHQSQESRGTDPPERDRREDEVVRSATLTCRQQPKLDAEQDD
jgi:hypothetical protein